MFHTVSHKRKLPVPFYEVLDQEFAALHDVDPSKYSWEFLPAHLKGSPSDLIEKIRPLFSPDDQTILPETCSKEELAGWLNRLIHKPGNLYDDRQLPKGTFTKETVVLAKLDLDPGERARVNRLLLEEAYSDYLSKIHEIHLAAVYQRIHQAESRTALCLSGGGIRSATFALGVIQGLARRDLLKEFDYLSTVSGGGYIGGWLSSWIRRAGAAEKVFAALKGDRACSPMEPESKPLRHLRMFSNYLTPKLGAFSADTWVLVATYLRNLFLNWLVFGPILLALFALPRVNVSLLHARPPGWVITGGFLIGYFLAAWGMAYAIMNRPTVMDYFKEHGGKWFRRRGQGSFLIWCLAPICLAAIGITTSWAWVQNGAVADNENPILRAILWVICGTLGLSSPKILNYCVLGAVLHLTGWVIAERYLRRWRGIGASALRGELIAVVSTGTLGGFLLWSAATLSFRCVDAPPGLALYSCFAVPVFLTLFLLGATLFVGISSNRTSDEDREWWSRMGAWVLIVVIGWGLFSALILFGPLGLLSLPKTLGALGGLSGLFTVVIGHSSGTSANKEKKAKEDFVAYLLDKALGLAAPLALVMLVATFSLTTSWLLVWAMKGSNLLSKNNSSLADLHPFLSFEDVVHFTPLGWAAGFTLAAALIGFGLSLFINVNRFSLHAIYRNRLVRAYLGASNSRRNPNPFAGFDPDDNLPLQDLRNPQNSALPQRPIQIVNMALNLVGGDDLAWQQRKAETFTASTLHCGNYRLGYRMTKHYALNEKALGLTLGTAVAISGAAASPNQGYHSSSMVALLMTLFNVRLGWWLGNPGAAGHATFQNSAPWPPVRHMVKEGLGLTDATSPYVYLSDGGHFENLGVYEMILRRCRLIVVSDAGCDPKCNLEDLGNAIRKIRVDLGVKIEIKKFGIYPRTDEESRKVGRYCAVAEIDYSSVDPNGRKGILIYFKPALRGDEPRDIYNYSRSSETFPHETTSDQWFSESQFESYRALGQHVIDRIYEEPLNPELQDPQLAEGLPGFVARVCQYADNNPPPAGWRDKVNLSAVSGFVATG